MEIPSYFNQRVYACPECIEDKKVVVMGLSEYAQFQFDKNTLELICPICGYESPQYSSNQYTGQLEACEWVNIHYESWKEELRTRDDFELIREPNFDEDGFFCDELTLTKRNRRPFDGEYKQKRGRRRRRIRKKNRRMLKQKGKEKGLVISAQKKEEE